MAWVQRTTGLDQTTVEFGLATLMLCPVRLGVPCRTDRLVPPDVTALLKANPAWLEVLALAVDVNGPERAAVVGALDQFREEAAA